jgi:citrate lyase synthetase
MKQIILLSMFVGLAFQTLSQNNSKIMSKEAVSVTCKLTTPELQERKKTVIAEVKKLVVKRDETTNGVRYLFNDSDSTIDLLTNFIKTERLCCSFFEFNLVVDQGFVTLELTGPEGTKDFIESEIGF